MNAPRVCIIGAGAYGLAIAAHLRFAGVGFRIFGSAMRRWLSQMPRSMLLKSEGCASSLPDPGGSLSLAQYCLEEGLPYSEYGTPISRDVFSRYGLAFQRKLVPAVEDTLVTAVRKSHDGFELCLSTGEMLRAANIVVATGLEYMEHLPAELRGLPKELCSHSADHYDFAKFNNKHVAVIGGGQSALETAAILREKGACVSLLVRRSALVWNRIPSTARRSLYARLRRPRTRLGDGLQLWMYDRAPVLFHYLPRRVRLSRVRASLGPAGAWWLRDRVIGSVPVFLGHRIGAAEPRGGRVSLGVIDQDQRAKEIVADHVIAATGYRFDLRNLPFLDDMLKSQIQHEDKMPKLSANFECSVPGLYFVGLASANSYGPVMRFVAGTGYTASRIAAHIAGKQARPATAFAEPERCLEA